MSWCHPTHAQEQIWAHTEECLDKKLAELARLREAGRPFVNASKLLNSWDADNHYISGPDLNLSVAHLRALAAALGDAK